MQPGGRNHRWGALTRGEIAAARQAGAFAVLPTGSVEQHGEHLPVDTDLVAVERIALMAAERCREAFALVLPGVPFGVAPEHAAWAGTVTLSAGTLLAILREVAQSLQRTGFSRLLVVNGHGGNSAVLAGFELPGLTIGVVDYWSPGQSAWSAVNPGGKPTMGHACAYETSLQAAIRGGEPILRRAAGLPPRLARPGGAVLDFPAGDPGYYGDPAAASLTAGQTMLELTVAGLAQLFDEFGAPP